MPSRTERFQQKVAVVGDCWEWQGCIIAAGYGQFFDGTRVVYAHRFSYEQAHGPIAPRLQIDHLCRNRRCVRPDHLEAVTVRTNLLRGHGAPARNARKRLCPRGHALEGTNLYVRPSGNRECRTCKAAAVRSRRATNGATA